MIENEASEVDEIVEFEKHTKKQKIRAIVIASLVGLGIIVLGVSLIGGLLHIINVTVKVILGV